jgi:phospholipid/cholesterol/gamma-HCH transport system permease protein
VVIYITATTIMREFGVLITAIMVAGRSGSAFTAEIGTMVVGEEVDALRTLGLDPIEVLVIPRLIALIITLPLLSFFADILGLFGSSLLLWFAFGLSPTLYIHQLAEISITHFWVGMVKAPVFAVIIALIGCYEGLRASGSAESVGRQTTRSVVESVFVVIVLDALFSVFFDVLGI